MKKTAHVLHRSPGLSRDQFRTAYEAAWSPGRRESGNDPLHSCLHFPLETDELRTRATGGSPRPAACDGLTLHWWSDHPPALDPATRRPAEALARVDTYLLEEHVHWDDLGERRRPGEPSPGLKIVAFVRRKPDLSTSDFRERYLEHAALARVHHPGIARYVQNFVEDQRAEGARPVDAIAELHFGSETDLTHRFYRDEASVDAIARDVDRFLSRREGWSILTIERQID